MQAPHGSVKVLRVERYRLTTAEILYHFPDYPSLLQSFVWQDIDLAPKFKELTKFLVFLEGNIEFNRH